MKRKLVAGILLAAMCATPLTAMAAETDKEAVSFTMAMLSSEHGEEILKEGTIFDQFCQNENVSFELVELLPDLTQAALMLNSATYPDVLFGVGMWDAKEITTYAEQEIFIPLKDLIKEYAPNLTAVLDEYDLWGALEVNGDIYDIPYIYSPQIIGTQYFFMNEQWLENLGLDMPTNTDELYEVLKAFKEQDANGNGDPDDEIPFTGYSSAKLSMIYPYFFDQFMLSSWTAFDGDEVYLCSYSEGYYEFLEFWRKCYEEGLMEEDCFTQDGDALRAVGQAGDVYGSFLAWGPSDAVAEENQGNYGIVPAFTESGYPSGVSLYRGNLMITDTCENPERVIAWVDQFFTDEGALACYLGTEGVDYNLVDGKYELITDAEENELTRVTTSAIVPSKQMAETQTNSVDEVSAKLFGAKVNMAETGWAAPTWVLTSEQNEVYATYSNDLWTYWNAYTAEVVTGAKDLESTWEQYMSDMKGLGAEKVVEAYQEAWDAMNE